MVQEGLVGSLTNRGGNTTGYKHSGPRAQRQAPGVPDGNAADGTPDGGAGRRRRVVAGADRRATGSGAAARRGPLDQERREIRGCRAHARASQGRRCGGAEAVNLLASPLFDSSSRPAIFAKATMLGLPTISQWPESINEGAVLAYGPNLVATFRQLGRIIGKVLRGARLIRFRSSSRPRSNWPSI